MGDFFGELLQNRVLMAAAAGWLAAQVLKTLLVLIMERELRWERLVGSGGMPSSHSATVCAMVVATARFCGVHSTLFALAVVIAVIVMYDAMGVRYETGEQAKILNHMLREWMDQNSESMPFLRDTKLKEMVGHTPIEVVSGAALGILLGYLMPLP